MGWTRGVSPPEQWRLQGRLLPPGELAQYTLMNGWHWYSASPNIPDEGWKIHVSGNTTNAPEIYRRLLPGLRTRGFAHKILPMVSEVAGQTGNQAGKILCVYPQNLADAFRAVALIDAALSPQARASSPTIPGDVPVGHTVVYTRYGGFNNDYVLNPTTNQLDVYSPGGTAYPAWIVNPWGTFPAAPVGVAPWPQHPRAGRRLGAVARA